MNELTMAYVLMAVVVAVLWLWIKSSHGQKWIKNL